MQDGISQRELAHRTGIPQAHISKMERGMVDVQWLTAVTAARALGLEVMVVPRRFVPAVESIVRSKPDEPSKPMYSLADD